jgi:diaminohydroxyphosphoribosylaminopyrimidine deaminase/5-amino-6-(5-phosphoribosylamino)uracil reductase
MLAALEQAWLGQGRCAPNPSVGAVAVHKGEIIARGWHQGVGTAHAEQVVLTQLPKGLQNVTLFVTLEPCNHWGRTPPCVEAIIDAGIFEVIYGFRDPNPVVAANNTPERLQARGIKASHYPLAEIDAFYQSYAYWTRTKMPWVTAKLAHSLDAKIAKQAGERTRLTNNECAVFTHQNRLHADLILTTAKTIRSDAPLLNARIEEKVYSKPLAILDSKLSLDKTTQAIALARHCHIFHDEACTVTAPNANCTYHGVPVNAGLLDLKAVVTRLGQLGFHDVWVEAGGTCFSALHKEGLVQRTYLYIAPTLLGNEAVSAYLGEIFMKKPRVTWQIKADNVIACLDWQEKSCLQE